MTATLIDRRDARAIKQIVHDLAVSVETVPTGDGKFFTAARLDFLLQLRDEFGDEGMADCYAVIDGPGLRALKGPAGLHSLDDELRAMRAVEERKARVRESLDAPFPQTTLRPGSHLTKPPQTTLRPERSAPPPPGAPALGPSAGIDTAQRDAIKEEITAAKKTLGLSSAQLGAALGVGESSVYLWLRGRFRPTPDKLAAMRRLVAEHEATVEPAHRQATAPPHASICPPEHRPMTAAEFRAARAALGMTCLQMAQALGVSTWAVRKWSRWATVPSATNQRAIRAMVAAHEQKGARP